MLMELSIMAKEFLQKRVRENQAELDAIGKGGRAENFSRMIVHDEKYIFIYRKNDRVIDYLSYSPDLYSILTIPSICSYKRNTKGRTQIELMDYRHKGKTYSPLLNRFAYYYYNSGMNAERFMNEFQGINELSKKDGIEIDHANNDFTNNCHWNLSALSKPENGSGGKGSLLAQIKPPYFCFIVVVPTGGYRLKFGYIVADREHHGLIGQEWFIFCPSIEMLNSFLRSIFEDFVSVNKLPVHLADWGNPQYRRATFKEQKVYFASDFEASAKMAEELLGMNEDEFVIWDGKNKWEVG